MWLQIRGRANCVYSPNNIQPPTDRGIRDCSGDDYDEAESKYTSELLSYPFMFEQVQLVPKSHLESKVVALQEVVHGAFLVNDEPDVNFDAVDDYVQNP